MLNSYENLILNIFMVIQLFRYYFKSTSQNEMEFLYDLLLENFKLNELEIAFKIKKIVT